MVKKLQRSGTYAALVVGWIAFVIGLLIEKPFVSVVLLAVARVLPLRGDSIGHLQRPPRPAIEA
jgi:hypothetical protein